MDVLDAAEAAGKAIEEISDNAYQRGLSEGRKRGLAEAVEVIKESAGDPDVLRYSIEAIEAALEKVSNGGGE